MSKQGGGQFYKLILLCNHFSYEITQSKTKRILQVDLLRRGTGAARWRHCPKLCGRMEKMESLVPVRLLPAILMMQREVSTTDCGLTTREDMESRPSLAGEDKWYNYYGDRVFLLSISFVY